MQKQNLEGRRFSSLLVISQAPNLKHHTRWYCLCDCGKGKTINTYSLTSRKTKSCGCLAVRKFKERITKHKGWGTPLYNNWRAMKARCSLASYHSYHRYGGRGINLTPSWESFKTFEQWAIQNGYEEGLTLDRINNNGDYTPDNCRWVTRKQQMQNTSSIKYNLHDKRIMKEMKHRQVPTQWVCKLYNINRSYLWRITQ